MGQRPLNPLAFTTALPNQLDPALNPTRTPRTGANNAADRLDGEAAPGRGARNDQLLINDLDNAIGALQAEDTTIDEQRTGLIPADLQQQTGQKGIAERGAYLDVIA
ncbi:MAG: hypothetical protein Kow0099_10590 [Candidatus Abyssubacteria bacterium]